MVLVMQIMKRFLCNDYRETLQGKWLREFDAGTAINVECINEKIIVSVASHD